MARIRSIKPGFFKNENLAELSPWHRLCFAGLWCQADKAGRLEDRPKRLKAEIFPYDESVDMPQLLTDLVTRGFAIRYEVHGVRYLAIPEESWEKHQRPRDDETPSILPPPTAGTVEGLSRSSSSVTAANNGDSKTVQKQSRCSDESDTAQSSRELGSGSRELGTGNRDTARERARERFDRWWQVYPKKVGKEAAWREWQKLRPDETKLSEMIAKVTEQKPSRDWLKDDGQFIPNPQTWLHQGRWQDEVGTSKPKAPHWSDACKHGCKTFPQHQMECFKDTQRAGS